MDSLLIPANHNIFWGKITFCALSFSFGVYTNNPEHVLLVFCGATFSQYLSNKNHDTLRVAFHRVLRYIVIYLFIEWSERAFHMILFASCMGHVTIVLLYSEGMSLIRMKEGHLTFVKPCCSFKLDFNTTAFKYQKNEEEKKNLIYLVLRNTFSSCQYCINLYQINNSLGIHSCNFYLYIYM